MKTNYEIAVEVLSGIWGNGQERRDKLTGAGYDYNAVQSIVNALVKDGYIPEQKTEEQVKTDSDFLKLEYDPKKHKGIEITILI